MGSKSLSGDPWKMIFESLNLWYFQNSHNFPSVYHQNDFETDI